LPEEIVFYDLFKREKLLHLINSLQSYLQTLISATTERYLEFKSLHHSFIKHAKLKPFSAKQFK